MNHNKLYLSGFITLVAMLACVIPSQTTQLVPTADPNAIGTFIAETAQASAQQTEQANLVGVPTPTILSTETPMSTPVVSAQGTSLETKAEGSILFTDHKVGIQLTIPSGWLPVRVNEDEYYKAFALEAVLANPAISDRLTNIRNNNIDYFRLNAIDIRPGHVVNGMISDITVILQPENSKNLSEWAEIEKQRVSRSVSKGDKLLSSQFQQTADGTTILVIEESWDFNLGGTVYLRRVFFSLPAGIVVLDFQTYLDFKDTVLLDFEQVVNSLTLLNP